MKSLIAILLFVIALIPKGVPLDSVELYAQSGIVYEVDYENDLVIVEDYVGFRWSFFGTEDWEEGDLCSMIMCNMGTQNIRDDEIITTKYSGYADFLK